MKMAPVAPSDTGVPVIARQPVLRKTYVVPCNASASEPAPSRSKKKAWGKTARAGGDAAASSTSGSTSAAYQERLMYDHVFGRRRVQMVLSAAAEAKVLQSAEQQQQQQHQQQQLLPSLHPAGRIAPIKRRFSLVDKKSKAPHASNFSLEVDAASGQSRVVMKKQGERGFQDLAAIPDPPVLAVPFNPAEDEYLNAGFTSRPQPKSSGAAAKPDDAKNGEHLISPPAHVAARTVTVEKTPPEEQEGEEWEKEEEKEDYDEEEEDVVTLWSPTWEVDIALEEIRMRKAFSEESLVDDFDRNVEARRQLRLPGWTRPYISLFALAVAGVCMVLIMVYGLLFEKKSEFDVANGLALQDGFVTSRWLLVSFLGLIFSFLVEEPLLIVVKFLLMWLLRGKVISKVLTAVSVKLTGSA
jgi:hypothetical protein